MLPEELIVEALTYLPFIEVKYYGKYLLKILSLPIASQYLQEFHLPSLSFAGGVITSTSTLQLEKLTSLRLLSCGDMKVLVSLDSNIALNRLSFLLLLEDFITREKLQERISDIGTQVVMDINLTSPSFHRLLGYRYDFNTDIVVRTYRLALQELFRNYDWEFNTYIYSGKIPLDIVVEYTPLPPRIQEDAILLSIDSKNKLFRELYLFLSNRTIPIPNLLSEVTALGITTEDFIGLYTLASFLFKLSPERPHSTSQLPVLVGEASPVVLRMQEKQDLYVYFAN